MIATAQTTQRFIIFLCNNGFLPQSNLPKEDMTHSEPPDDFARPPPHMEWKDVTFQPRRPEQPSRITVVSPNSNRNSPTFREKILPNPNQLGSEVTDSGNKQRDLTSSANPTAHLHTWSKQDATSKASPTRHWNHCNH